MQDCISNKIDSEVVNKGLLKYHKGTMFKSKTRNYDYSTCTYEGKISKLRKINTQMAKEAKSKGVEGIQMPSVHQLMQDEEIKERDTSSNSSRGQLEEISESQAD